MPRQRKDQSAEGIVNVEGSNNVRCRACHMLNGIWIKPPMKRTTIPAHLRLDSHRDNLESWKQNQQGTVQRAQQLLDGLAAAYTPGEWDLDIPAMYHVPDLPRVPSALPNDPALPIQTSWSTEREHIPIVPPPVFDPCVEQERLQEQARLLRQLAKERDDFGEQFFDENDESVELREAFEALGIDDSASDEEAEETASETHKRESSPWAPWPDKISCLLHIINSFGRLRFSRAQTKLMLWLLKELKVPLMPSYNKLRKLERQTSSAVGSLEPIDEVSQLGNNFSVLDPRQTIALDLAQPVIAKNMALYPEIEADHVSEVWEALRWREFDRSQLNPMWTSDGFKRFYIDEIAQLVNSAFVIPLRKHVNLVEMQHDCCSRGCKASGSRTARQERISSGREVRFVEHVDAECFVINMHAMHNSHRIRRVLPRELIRPRHLYQNRVSRHHEMSKDMHVSQSTKRAETQAKAKATREQNAEKKAEKQIS